MLENVRGLLDREFDSYRHSILLRLAKLGYVPYGWKLLSASDFGVPQLRPRAILFALREDVPGEFHWPSPLPAKPVTVGETLGDAVAAAGWLGAAATASKVTPSPAS